MIVLSCSYISRWEWYVDTFFRLSTLLSRWWHSLTLGGASWFHFPLLLFVLYSVKGSSFCRKNEPIQSFFIDVVDMRIFCTYSQTARERVRKQRVMSIVSITLSVPRSSLKCEVVCTLKGRAKNFKVGKQILETRELAITCQVDLFSLEIISNHSQQNILVCIFDF